MFIFILLKNRKIPEENRVYKIKQKSLNLFLSRNSIDILE